MPAWSWSADDLARLRRYLEDGGLTSGPLRATAIGDGHSNLTYLVDDGERRVVVRRPPPPPLPRGANDVRREGRWLRALAGTAVPVPAVLAQSEAGEVLDVPMLVMAFVPGVVVADAVPPGLDDPEDRRRVGESLVDALVALHAVDVDAAGFGGRVAAADANARQTATMRRVLGDEEPDRLHALGMRLAASAPTAASVSLVHNDLRIGNVIIGTAPRAELRAVLDWELATVGDPVGDLAYLLASVPERGRPPTPVQRLGTAMLADGFPDAGALARRYADTSGRDLSSLGWHLAFADYKLAVLFEYARRRGEDGFYTAAQVDAFAGSAEARLSAVDDVDIFGLKVGPNVSSDADAATRGGARCGGR